MDIIPAHLDRTSQQLLMTYPVRNPYVKWRRKDGFAILEYRKEFNRVEKVIHRIIGGPTTIKRPLDRMGTPIWEMCDGQHKVVEICQEMDKQFHEEIEPAVQRVWAFIQMLLERNLVFLEKKPWEGEPSTPVEEKEEVVPVEET